jgi:hypothetical protein
MTLAEPSFLWSETDHSSPIVIITILVSIIGIAVCLAGIWVKYKDEKRREKGPLNNVTSALAIVRYRIPTRSIWHPARTSNTIR